MRGPNSIASRNTIRLEAASLRAKRSNPGVRAGSEILVQAPAEYGTWLTRPLDRFARNDGFSPQTAFRDEVVLRGRFEMG
jgi:hypothetical protein